jgi:adenylate cyclase
LTLRHIAHGKGPITQLGDLRGPMANILSDIAQQMNELEKYKAKYGELNDVESVNTLEDDTD